MLRRGNIYAYPSGLFRRLSWPVFFVVYLVCIYLYFPFLFSSLVLRAAPQQSLPPSYLFANSFPACGCLGVCYHLFPVTSRRDMMRPRSLYSIYVVFQNTEEEEETLSNQHIVKTFSWFLNPFSVLTIPPFHHFGSAGAVSFGAGANEYNAINCECVWAHACTMERKRHTVVECVLCFGLSLLIVLKKRKRTKKNKRTKKYESVWCINDRELRNTCFSSSAIFQRAATAVRATELSHRTGSALIREKGLHAGWWKHSR